MSGLASGLRNDAPDSALSQRQKWRLAEIRCEEYMFVVTSRLLNMLDGLGGPAFLASAHEKEWAQPLGAAVLAVRHCGLSGWQPDECMAVEEELAAWQKLGLAKTRVRTSLFFFLVCVCLTLITAYPGIGAAPDFMWYLSACSASTAATSRRIAICNETCRLVAVASRWS